MYGIFLYRSDQFQSTLPRRERPKLAALVFKRYDISIHAPAKGATAEGENASQGTDISIHAPAKGATRALLAQARFPVNFNPRSREGSDAGS